jgi:signal transduction histidine kinase
MGRSPLAQLLHALNQPLTGLQCSIEVTLARSRTAEQYAQSLREGLGLTERMRALVGAIREVAEVEDSREESLGAVVDWRSALLEAVEDLRPVAETKDVQLVCISDSLAVAPDRGKTRKPQLTQGIFRALESALALAEDGSVLRVEMGPGAEENWFRIQWKRERGRGIPALSGPELGLLLAQARLERMTAVWKRERAADGEILMVRMPRGSRAAESGTSSPQAILQESQ